MDPKHFEIKEYMIIWRQLEIQNFNGITAKVRAIVRCTGGDYAMDIFFLSEDSAYPDPFVEEKEKNHLSCEYIRPCLLLFLLRSVERVTMPNFEIVSYTYIFMRTI